MSFVILLVVIFIGYRYLNRPIIKQPKRSSNIPKIAKWIGGPDGGSWFQIYNVISKNNFKIKIYNENTGQIEVDTTFILNPDCSYNEIDSITLIKNISGYDGEKILLNLSDKDRNCFLQMK